ncbi:unnamed protein product, partial [Iphiclides podalirius]
MDILSRQVNNPNMGFQPNLAKLTRNFKVENESSLRPLALHDGSQAFQGDEKAECLADSFELLCSLSWHSTCPSAQIELKFYADDTARQ